MEIRRSLAVVAMALLLLGCQTAVPEPESAFTDLPPQTYPFGTVWECAVEAVELEAFAIDTSQRSGDAGEFATRFKETNRDKITGMREGTRVRVRCEPKGPETFRVRVAAGVFERRDDASDWSYVRGDPALAARIEENLQARLSRRYQPPGGEESSN